MQYRHYFSYNRLLKVGVQGLCFMVHPLIHTYTHTSVTQCVWNLGRYVAVMRAKGNINVSPLLPVEETSAVSWYLIRRGATPLIRHEIS
jgi:hypothetical protein